MKKGFCTKNAEALLCIKVKSHLVDCASETGVSGNSICLIGVDVHSSCKLVGYTANNITEDSLSSVSVDLYPNDLLVLNAKLLSVCGSEVDMTLCNDDALGKLNLAAGANQLTGT